MSTVGRSIRAYAPGRVNVIGEHTDYNDGYALPIALQVGTTATLTTYEVGGAEQGSVGAHEPGVLIATSALESDEVRIPLDTEPGEVAGWAAYVAGCVWALREHGVIPHSGRLHLKSEVPIGAGLSSSAAVECAVLLACTAHLDTPLDRTTLARIAQRAENAYVGAPTGLLDQMASLHGQADTALLLDFRTLEVDPVPFDLGADVLLAIDSHTPHQHAAGEYGRRRSACEAAAASLGAASLRDVSDDAWKKLPPGENRNRARHVLTENRRVLLTAEALRAGDHTTVGELMNDSHASMRDDFEITVPAIDVITDVACELGAYGARMTGGGFGGTVIALAPAAAAAAISDRLPSVVHGAGHPLPTVTAIRPGRGAHLLG